MDPIGTAGGIESRFATYAERLASALDHADRAAPFRAYCTGLILPGERKSVEPMFASLRRRPTRRLCVAHGRPAQAGGDWMIVG